MDREVVKELIQNDFTKENLREELTNILEENHRIKLFSEYYELEKILGGKGASEKVAKAIIKELIP
jgi:lipid-A-disaccharide synthase